MREDHYERVAHSASLPSGRLGINSKHDDQGRMIVAEQSVRLIELETICCVRRKDIGYKYRTLKINLKETPIN